MRAICDDFLDFAAFLKANLADHPTPHVALLQVFEKAHVSVEKPVFLGNFDILVFQCSQQDALGTRTRQKERKYLVEDVRFGVLQNLLGRSWCVRLG